MADDGHDQEGAVVYRSSRVCQLIDGLTGTEQASVVVGVVLWVVLRSVERTWSGICDVKEGDERHKEQRP
jgi:hypothetical protein